MAKEFGPRHIAVNAGSPGAIETDFFEGAVRDTRPSSKFFADMTALGRVGQSGEIGPIMANLLEPANGWIDAKRLKWSGGSASAKIVALGLKVRPDVRFVHRVD